MGSARSGHKPMYPEEYHHTWCKSMSAFPERGERRSEVMGVYIIGMEMPKEKAIDVTILPNGGAIVWGTTHYYGPTQQLKATEVPEPHGPLVDEDLIRKRLKLWIVGGTDGHTLNDFLNFAEIPTVIERSK